MEQYLYNDLYQLEETHWWHRAKRMYALTLIRMVTTRHPLRILDVGCGTGKNLEVFRALGSTEGIDISPEAIAFCHKRGIQKVRIGDATKTAYANNSFDGVLLFDIIEHTEDEETVKEMYRIVKPGGFMILTVPAYTWLWSRWDEVLHHKRRYTRDSLRTLLKHHGFCVLRISYVYSFLVIPALCIRYVKQLFYWKHMYPSDFVLSSSFLNIILFYLCTLELGILRYWSIPFGTSIITITRKNNDK